MNLVKIFLFLANLFFICNAVKVSKKSMEEAVAIENKETSEIGTILGIRITFLLLKNEDSSALRQNLTHLVKH